MKVLEYKDGRIQMSNKGERSLKCDEVRIKIKYAGICGTDLQIIKGNQKIKDGITLGHEAVGQIVELGKNVKNYDVNDFVIIDPNMYCGCCYYCKKGMTNFCSDNGLRITGTPDWSCLPEI